MESVTCSCTQFFLHWATEKNDLQAVPRQKFQES